MLNALHTLLHWVLLVVLILTSATLLKAQSALTDDAQTSNTSKTADKNFGATPTLIVSPTTNAYLKFKLSSTLPAGTTRADIAKATVKLYIGNITTPGKLDVYQVAGSWEEGVLSFNSAPTNGALLTTTAQLEVDKKNEFVIVDITQAVKDWLGDDGQGTNGAANYGLVLVAHPVDADTPTLANITFDSKENVQTSHEPELNIALAKPAGLQGVTHDGTLAGDGTSASPLRLGNQSVGTAQLADGSINGIKLSDLIITSQKLADGAVTNEKIAAGAVSSSNIASGQVAKTVNGLTDNVTIEGGSNISVTPSGNTLTISGTGLSSIAHGPTLVGTGASGSPLGIATPLSLTGTGSSATLSVANTGGGAAIAATGPITTSDQYRIGADRILSNPGSNNIFVGVGSGLNNTGGFGNSFYGNFAGRANTTGNDNSFYGRNAGFSNTTGSANAFFGGGAGQTNTTGQANTFVGTFAGASNTSGGFNSFVGSNAGQSNTTGHSNAFFGRAGVNNTTGFENSFFGPFVAFSNTTGRSNAFFGAQNGNENTTGSYNAFFGAYAGQQNTTGDSNTFIGVGAGTSNTTESNNTFIGAGADGFAGIQNGTAIGANAHVHRSNSVVLGDGFVNVGIGDSAPSAKLTVTGGKVFLATPGEGVILKSFGGTCVEIKATDAGSLTTAIVQCPQ